MRPLVALILAAGSMFAHAQTAAPLTAGEIRGKVTDQNGSPVAGVTVFAVPQGTGLEDITLRSVKTDSNGRFDFRGGFQLEAYKLYSRKEEDSYPNPLDRFYAGAKDEAPRVDLTADPAATMAVKLLDKAGILTGRVIDAETGAETKADLTFVDSDGNGNHVIADGKFRALLPPGKALTIMVATTTPPYRAQRPVAPLQLEPGQYVYMEIPVARQ